MKKSIEPSELKQLLWFAYPERRLLFWGTLFLALGSLVLLTFPQAVRITIDQAVQTSDLALINKGDLLPYLDIDIDLMIANARRINPNINVIQISAKTGAGMPAWLAWIMAAQAAHLPTSAAE